MAKQPHTRRVVFQPATRHSIQQGINKMAGAIRPTLGPQPRLVAIESPVKSDPIELVDNGGLIAQRIIQLPGRSEDVGAMFLRDTLWRLKDQVGDGTATAAVLFQVIFNEGVRYLAAGGNARRLQAHLESGLEAVLDHLAGMTMAVSGQEKLARLAESLCYEPLMANYLGEIFDIIGQYGRLEVRAGRGRSLEREYVEGMYWDRGLVSREMVTDRQRQRVDMENAALLVSDLNLNDPRQLFPPLEVAIQAKIPALLIIGSQFSNNVINFVLANKQPEKFQAVAVKTPGWGQHEQAAALADLVVLTGGRTFIEAAGDTFKSIKVEDFGRARRVWATQQQFGLVGGKGDARALRRHLAALRRSYEQSDEAPARLEKLQARIGKLLGGTATLWIGGATERQIEARKALAERTAATMRAAMREGVLPGGGVALLESRSALQPMLERATDPDERAAYRILMQALKEPMRTLIGNAGYDAGDVMADIRLAGPGHGFDVKREQVVNMLDHVWDAALVQKTALYTAVSSAALALTLDVLVHRREQPTHASVHAPTARRKRL